MNNIFNEVARIHNITGDEVEREIQLAIMTARKNPSPNAKAFWGRIDDDASVEDVIGHIVSRIALVV